MTNDLWSNHNTMQIIVFGCGAVGRGLLAPLFCKAGHAVIFVETDSWIVSELCRRRYLPTRTAANGEFTFVGPCAALNPNPTVAEYEDRIGIYQQLSTRIIANADLIVVAVRVENLPAVAETLMSALSNRPSIPLPIWVCENTPNAADKLEALVGGIANVAYRSAIAECVIPEMPHEMRACDPLLTYVDPRGYLVVDSGEMVIGKQPQIAGVRYSDNFAFDWDLKWYCHCALHAVIALLGLKAGHTFIHEAMGDANVRHKVVGFADAVKKELQFRYAEEGEQIRIADRLNAEFAQLRDPARPDLCSRVARDAARKLQPGERLMDALALVGGKNAVIEEVIEYAKSQIAK